MANRVLFVLPQFLWILLVLYALTSSYTVSVLLTLSVSVLFICYLSVKQVGTDRKVIFGCELGSNSSIAHRGAGIDAPENTIAAFKQAKKNGAYGVEFDLEMTRDGVIVLLHDETVDRTTDGSGNIRELDYSYVKTLDAGCKHTHSDHFADERIPMVEDAVKCCLELDLMMFFDVKNPNYKIVEFIVGLFKVYPELYKKAVIASFYPQVIYKIRRTDPAVITGLIHRPKFFSEEGNGVYRAAPYWVTAYRIILDLLIEWGHVSWMWYLCGNSCLLLDKRVICERVTQHFERRNITVVPWTVNSSIEKHYFHEVLKLPTAITDTLHT